MEDREVEYAEDFTKTIQASGLDYTLTQIREVHSADKGWEVGQYKILETLPNGEIKISVPLKKYAVPSNEFGRSR